MNLLVVNIFITFVADKYPKFMKHLLYFMALALAVGCTESFDTELVPPQDLPNDAGRYSIAVDMAPVSRVAMEDKNGDGNYPLHWQAGDQIIINGTSVSDPLSPLFDGEKSAIFTTDHAPEYPLTIIYPGSMLSDEGKIMIPSEQTLLQERLANGNGVIIGYTVDAQDPLVVKHACAYIKVSLRGSASLKKVVLLATAGERLSGQFTYNGEHLAIAGVAPAQKGTSDEIQRTVDGVNNFAPVESCSYVDIAANKMLSTEPLDFVFAIPAGTYAKGFTMIAVDYSGNAMRRTLYGDSGTTLAAGSILNMPTLDYVAEKPHGIYSASDWISFATDTNHSAWSADGKNINLYADIDLSGYESVPIASIDHGYTLNGNNHTISGINETCDTKYGGLLFSYIDRGAKVKNLTLGATAGDGADCRLTVTTSVTTNSAVFASPFCIVTLGDIEGCTNNASLDLKIGGEKFSIIAGGIVSGFCNSSIAVGNLTSCHNAGHITLSSESAASYNAWRIGGVVGRAVDMDITNCSNSGKISIACNKSLAYPQVGGVVGVSSSATTTLSGCRNTGDVEVNLSAAHTSYAYIGGVAGVCAHNVSDCHNEGKVSAVASKHTYLGGVLGYLSADKSLIISSCTNRGYVLFDSVYSGYNFVGGVCGYSTTEGETTAANKMEKCTNYGTVEMCNKGRVRMGGISGGTCIMTGNTNYGTVKYSSATGRKSSHIGGLAGTFGHTFTSCNNYGNVEFAAPESLVAAGGFSGLAVKRNCSFLDCKADCTVIGFTHSMVSAEDGESYTSSIGLLFGDALARVATVGTESQPTKVAGTVIRDGVTITVDGQDDVTSDNLLGRATTGSINLTHTIYEATKPAKIE